MANNYIPGFTPSLHGRPVKRMALGGRMEGDRLFRERDDTIDYEAVGNPLGNLQNTLSNIDANSVLANYNNSVGSTAADTYQSQPTPQPVQTAAYTPDTTTYSPSAYSYDPYGIGNFDLSSYQSQPTAAQLAARDQELTKPGVSNAQWDPLSNSFMYDKAPVPTAQPTGPYYVDPGEFDPVYNPYNIGNFGLSSYQQSGPTAAQLAARDLELTKPGVAGAQWDPQANAFMYTRVPIKVTEPLTIQATSPLPPQSQPTTAAPYSGDATTPSAAPTFNFSPEEQAKFATALKNAQAQYAAVNDPAYLANQQAKDEWLKQQYQQGNYYTPAYDPLDFAANSGGILNLFAPTTKPAFDPNNPTANMQQVYYFDTGVKGGSPDPYTGEMTYKNAGPVPYYPGVTTTMYDAKGNVIGSASTPEEMKKLADLSNTVGVYTLRQSGTPTGPLATSYGSAGSLPTKTDAGSLSSMLLNMAALALPAVGGAVLGPALAGAGGLGIGVSAPVGVGLGTAAGTAASGALAGKSLKDILLQSALSGLTAGGLSALTTPGVPGAGVDPTAQYIKTLTGVDVPSSVFGGASFGGAGGGGGGGSFAGTDAGGNFINVLGSTGSKIPTSFLSGALNAAGTAPGGANYGDQVWNRPAAQETEVKEPGSSEFNPDEGIVVKAGKYDIPFDPTSILNKFLTADYTGTPDYGGYQDLINKYLDMYDVQGPPEEIPEGSDEGWDVVAPKENVVLPPPASLPDLFPPLNSVDIPTDLVKEWPEVPAEDNEIVVKGYPPRAPDLLPPFFPPLNSVDIPPADTLTPPKDNPPPPDDKPPPPPPGDKPPKPDIDDILKWLPPLIGTVVTTSSTPKSSFSAARGPLNPIFSAKLPKPNMRMAMPRALNFDAYRYGYGPEQSFFTNVPQGALNTSTAYTGYGTSPRYNATEQYAADFSALAEAIRKAREEEELKQEEGMAESAFGIPNASALFNQQSADFSPAIAQAANFNALPQVSEPVAKTLASAPQAATPSELTPAGKALFDWQIQNGPDHDPAKVLDYVNSLNDYQRLATYATLAGLATNADQIRQTSTGMSNYDILKELIEKTGIDVVNDQSTTPRSTKFAYGGKVAPSQHARGLSRHSFAVGGPGDGRDDKIPAMLSDGEYVIDAETVAMLGNGSNKAGAEALDKLRVNVRKHKGRQLSKGKFSVNAKKPEQYLKGRK